MPLGDKPHRPQVQHCAYELDVAHGIAQDGEEDGIDTWRPVDPVNCL